MNLVLEGVDRYILSNCCILVSVISLYFFLRLYMHIRFLDICSIVASYTAHFVIT